MSCNCKSVKNRLERLQIKYGALKKSHKKLLGITILLTDTLEVFIKEGINGDVISKLELCCELYPDLFEKTKTKVEEISAKCDIADETNLDQIANENLKILESATESEKEYYEGFLARPKIPRTPQQ